MEERDNNSEKERFVPIEKDWVPNVDRPWIEAKKPWIDKEKVKNWFKPKILDE